MRIYRKTTHTFTPEQLNKLAAIAYYTGTTKSAWLQSQIDKEYAKLEKKMHFKMWVKNQINE